MTKFSSPFLAKSPLKNNGSHVEVETHNYTGQKQDKVKKAYVSDSKITQIENPENITQQHTAQITNKPFINSFLQTEGEETTGEFKKNKKVRTLEGDRAINKYKRVKDRSHKRLRKIIKT